MHLFMLPFRASPIPGSAALQGLEGYVYDTLRGLPRIGFVINFSETVIIAI